MGRRLAKKKAADQRHLAAAGQGGQLGGVLPVAHPRDPKAGLIEWGVGEGCGGVKILAPVGPVGTGAGVVLRKVRAVEPADKILVGRAAGGAARVDIDAENPALGGEVSLVVNHGKLEQVGALPGARNGAGGTELTGESPFAEVLRAVEADFVLLGKRDHHHPALARGVPEDLGVAEAHESKIEDGIAGKFRPGASAIAAEGEVLVLQVRGRAGIDGDQTAGSLLARVAAEAAGVVAVLDRGAAEDGHAILFRDGEGELLPVDEVGRDRVAPAHVDPLVAGGVQLEE